MSRNSHSRALRQGRVSIPGQVYLVTAATHARRDLFLDFQIGCLASRLLTGSQMWPDAVLLAWVLMPDHFHLLIQLGEREPLALVMQRVKALLSTALRRELADTRIWQAGYHERAIRRSDSLRDAARYIVANPVRAGLVTRIGDYPFWDACWLTPGASPLDP